jgi:hypothetical protein
MLNLGSRTGLSILKRWEAAFASISDEALKSNVSPFTGPEDQVLLHNLLKEDETLWPDIHLESPDLINSAHATFIRQNLRSYNSDFDSRQLAIEEAVNAVMSSEAALQEKTQHEKIVSAVYAAVLGRAPDIAGFTAYSKTLEINGVERGLQKMITSLLSSQEYTSRPE